jgi:hypothetical protein
MYMVAVNIHVCTASKLSSIMIATPKAEVNSSATVVCPIVPKNPVKAMCPSFAKGFRATEPENEH